MAAQRCRTATQNGPKSFELLKTKARVDTAPKSDRLVYAECRPPQGWAESFLFFSLKATTDALGASQS